MKIFELSLMALLCLLVCFTVNSLAEKSAKSKVGIKQCIIKKDCNLVR